MDKETKLERFIQANHSIVMTYHERNYQRLTCLADNKVDVIQSLFLSALEAAGGSVPIDAKYKSCETFSRNLSKLPDKDAFTFAEFAGCFINDFSRPSQLSDLEQHFIRGDGESAYPHFGLKKTRLFLKELILLGGSNLFTNFNKEDYMAHLSVPIDAVLRKVYCKFKSIEGTNSTRHDMEIQELAMRLFADQAILFDDVWFWGHFCFNKTELLETGNEKMIVTDRILTPALIEEQDLMKKCSEFINIIRSTMPKRALITNIVSAGKNSPSSGKNPYQQVHTG